MPDTDYKRLWRREKDENIKLSNKIVELQEQVKTQADILRKIRDGEIKLEEIKNG